nr:unnamed protein product [Digitaria exilis]
MVVEQLHILREVAVVVEPLHILYEVAVEVEPLHLLLKVVVVAAAVNLLYVHRKMVAIAVVEVEVAIVKKLPIV